MNRRAFVLSALALGGSALLPLPSLAGNASGSTWWDRPRELRLYRPETDERLTALYWDGGLVADGYAALCSLLRDPKTNLAVQMDARLLDILFGLQEFAGSALGKPSTIEITDGYRTAHTNARLRERGLPAARLSQHLYGRAADIKVPGIPVQQLAQVAKRIRGGGVGIYADGHLHVDSGRLRSWRG